MIVAILPLQGLTITHFHSLNADITGMLSEIFKIPVKNDGIVFLVFVLLERELTCRTRSHDVTCHRQR